MKMRAAVLDRMGAEPPYAVSKPLRIETVTLDPPGRGELLVRIAEPRGSPGMAEPGRIGWQRATGYGRSNQAETAVGRYKHLIGPKLRARSRPAQLGEVSPSLSRCSTA